MHQKHRRNIALDRILFATDLSSCSEAALPHAATIAKKYGAKLYVVHVIPSEVYAAVPCDQRDGALESARRYAEERLSALIRYSVGPLPHEVLLDHGDVWPVLSDIVDQHKIDLIVVGTHGRRGIQKMLLGSVAEEVFRLATRPVLTVGPGNRQPPSSEPQLKQILFPTDFSADSVAALPYAGSLAEEYGATLVLLHATQSLAETSASIRAREANLFLEHLPRAGVAELGVKPEFIVRAGAPAECILNAAVEFRADLIVMGVRSGGGGLGQFLPHLPGHTAFEVVSEAACPVLTVRWGTARPRTEAEESNVGQL